AVGEVARDVGLAAAGGADEQEVRLLDQPPRLGLGAALQVVVGGDGDGALGALLPDDVGVEIGEDLARRQRGSLGGATRGHQRALAHPCLTRALICCKFYHGIQKYASCSLCRSSRRCSASPRSSSTTA